MLTPYMLLVGVVLPVAIAVVFFLTAWQPWRPTAQHGYWGGPLATGLAFALAFALLEGTSHLFPPRSATPWLFYLGLGFTVLGVLDSLVRLPIFLRGLLIFLATALAAGVLLKFNFTSGQWDTPHGVLYLGIIGLIGLATWFPLENTAADGDLAAPMAMAATTGLAALGTAMAADQTLGQALGAMALVMTVAIALTLWARRSLLARGTSIVVSGMTVMLLAAAAFVSPLELRTALLYALAPLTLLVGAIPAVHRQRTWLRVAIRIVPLLIVLGIAMAFAVAQFQREKADQASDPYSQMN